MMHLSKDDGSSTIEVISSRFRSLVVCRVQKRNRMAVRTVELGERIQNVIAGPVAIFFLHFEIGMTEFEYILERQSLRNEVEDGFDVLNWENTAENLSFHTGERGTDETGTVRDRDISID